LFTDHFKQGLYKHIKGSGDDAPTYDDPPSPSDSYPNNGNRKKKFWTFPRLAKGKKIIQAWQTIVKRPHLVSNSNIHAHTATER